MMGKLDRLHALINFWNRRPSEQPDFRDQLLAEAVRLHEDAQGFAIDDPQARANAQQVKGDFETRIIARARALTNAPILQTAFHQLHTTFGLTIGIAMFVALMSGIGVARMALNSVPNGPVMNFFWVLGSVLGVPTLALLIWLALLWVRPATMVSNSLGGDFIFLLMRRINQWLHKGPMHVAAAQATASVYTRTPVGRWTLSAISHLLWLVFLVGCLLSLLLILSTKQYTFAWETTILSDQSYIILTRALASLPEAVGFSTPSPEQIAASHWRGDGSPPHSAREAWSGLLIGSLMIYGILPRIILLVFCVLARQQAIMRFRLNITLPGYARLETRLLPASQSLGVVDPDEGKADPAPVSLLPSAPQPSSAAATGPPAIMGFEVSQPAAHWPPPIEGVQWLDLGFVDSRNDRKNTLDRVRQAPNPPRLIAIVCSVTMTPDRGTQGFISDVQQASSSPVVIILTDGQQLRERGSTHEAEQRLRDWRELAVNAQVGEEQVIDLDLNHLTEASRAKLTAAIKGAQTVSASGQHLEQAFTLIVQHVQGWSDNPNAGAQAELHRDIAALYRNQRNTWQALLRTQLPASGNVVGQLKSSANQMIDLLPERLRLNPRWHAAGALAGALGCVAAATLMAPAAITSLPLWAGLGAALPMVIKPTSKPQQLEQETVAMDFTEAVNGAALFALLLELQGNDEIQITRTIDRVVSDTEPPLIQDAEAARQWLDTLRERFDRVQGEGVTL
jgi:hypothetical protein